MESADTRWPPALSNQNLMLPAILPSQILAEAIHFLSSNTPGASRGDLHSHEERAGMLRHSAKPCPRPEPALIFQRLSYDGSGGFSTFTM